MEFDVLRASIIHCLEVTLSSNEPNERARAEQEIHNLSFVDLFPVVLTKLVIEEEANLALRQLSGILLKQYVEIHWSKLAEKFQSPETNEVAKHDIRTNLPKGLASPESRIRASVAYAISTIAQYDWPEDWPNLFNILMEGLSSGQPHIVHGTMRVLTEFSREITDTQVSHVCPILLPHLLEIFLHPKQYSIRTRCRSLTILNTLSGMVAMMEGVHKGISKTTIYPVLPQFLSAMLHVLQNPNHESTDTGLLRDLLTTLQGLMRHFPRVTNKHLEGILPAVWNLFTTNLSIYIETNVRSSADDESKLYDSDGEAIGFESLIFSIVDFIGFCLEEPKYEKIVLQNLDGLVHQLLLYSQITENQVEMWCNDPDQFIEDEDEEGYSFSVRLSAQDIFVTLRDFDEEGEKNEVTNTLMHVCFRLIQENRSNTQLQTIDWKLYEVILLTLGRFNSEITTISQAGLLEISMEKFWAELPVDLIFSDNFPFLAGRLLWFIGRFAKLTPRPYLTRCIELTSSVLTNQAVPAVVKICAARAVWSLCDILKDTSDCDCLFPYVTIWIMGLHDVMFRHSREVLALSLEAINAVLSIKDVFLHLNNADSLILPAASLVFSKYSEDPYIMPLVQDCFKSLAASPLLFPLVEECIVSVLDKSLSSSYSGDHSEKQGILLTAAMEVLESIIRCCTSNQLSPKLLSMFPVLVSFLLTTQDLAALQTGSDVIKAYVSVAPEQIAASKNERGESGIDMTFAVISRFLHPETTESASFNVGRLVNLVLLRWSRFVNPAPLEALLLSLAKKLSLCEQLSVQQSLITSFAFMFNTDFNSTLHILLNNHTATTEGSQISCLEFLLKEWCSKQHLLFGLYERKITTLALGKFVEYFLTGDNRQTLHNILVPGDHIAHSKRLLRSQGKIDDQTPQIPVIVKIVKLLINEYSNQQELVQSKLYDSTDSWTDEENEEEDLTTTDLFVGDEKSSPDALDNLVQLLNDAVDDAEEDDPDIVNDPFFEVDLPKYLKNFLTLLSQHGFFQSHIDFFSETDISCVHRALQ